MPVSRKAAPPLPAETTADAGRLTESPAAVPRQARTLPRKIVVLVIVRDESGSMGRYRQRQGEYIPTLLGGLTAAGGPRVADLVYVLHAVVSGGVVMADFAPLSAAAEPAYEPDGETPLGRALSAVADKCEQFFESRVFPDEVTVRDFRVLVFSDLHATDESAEETAAGVATFVAAAKKYRAKVQVVAPDGEAVDPALAKTLDVSGLGLKFLGDDPKAVLDVTLDSILQQSRKLTGSKPLRPR